MNTDLDVGPALDGICTLREAITNANAVASTVRRMRRRQQSLIRLAILPTVERPDDVEGELQDLVESL